MNWIIHTPAEMREIAAWVLDEVSKGARVIGLYGDLGAGKTTFSQILAQDLGVTEHVTSPTFVIQKAYDLSEKTAEAYRINKLIHIDAYRLETSHELEVLGWASLLAESKTLIVIEWPERVSDIMPENHLRIRISMEGEHNRKVTAAYI